MRSVRSGVSFLVLAVTLSTPGCTSAPPGQTTPQPESAPPIPAPVPPGSGLPPPPAAAAPLPAPPDLPIVFSAQPNVPYLVARPSGLVLSVPAAAREDGAPLRLASKTGQTQQLFAPESTQGGSVRLRGKHSGRLLQVVGASLEDGAGLEQRNGGGDEGHWRLSSTDGHLFRIVNQRSGKCLEPATEAADSAILQTICVPETDARAARQRWLVLPAKKGACFTTRNDGWEGRVSGLEPSWYYSWSASVPPTSPAGIEFIPMIWGYWNATEAFTNQMSTLTELGRRGELTHLLGFNEPDGAEQANMSVAKAMEGWPSLEATGLRLGSPAAVHADNAWMTDFMAQIDGNGHRVDFVTVHWYRGPNADSLVSWLERMHDLYKRPIWITEFAPADWSANAAQPNRYTPAQVEAFMSKALPMLDALPFVERYSWFSFAPTSAPGGVSALWDADGTLTRAGEIYRAHPFTAP